MERETDTLKRNWRMGDHEFAEKRIFSIFKSRLWRALDEKWFKKQTGSPSGLQRLLFWCEGQRKKEEKKSNAEHHIVALADRTGPCVSTSGPFLKKASVTRGREEATTVLEKITHAITESTLPQSFTPHSGVSKSKLRLWHYRVGRWWHEMERKKDEAEELGVMRWRAEEGEEETHSGQCSSWSLIHMDL